MRATEKKDKRGMGRKEEEIQKKEDRIKPWWNRECSRTKRKIERRYKSWKKGRYNKESYIEGKRKMRDLFREKQKGQRKKRS